MPTFHVQADEAGLSVIAYLQRKIPAAPPAYLKQLLKKGKVSSPAGPLGAEQILACDQPVRLPESRRLTELLATPLARSKPLHILYESREILVVDKPTGLAVHSSQGHELDNLTDQVAGLLRQRGQRLACAPVHRLDLGTSGPVIFGKGKQACGQLGQLFIRQQVEKRYLALVQGETAGSGQLISNVRAKGKLKQALCRYRALARATAASFLEVELLTGRQHQVRQQFAANGHPLFGDKRYRGPCPGRLDRLFLHCDQLRFPDPFSGAPVEVNSPLPKELRHFLEDYFTADELKALF